MSCFGIECVSWLVSCHYTLVNWIYEVFQKKKLTGEKQALPITVDEHHCRGCLCRNPALLAILQGKDVLSTTIEDTEDQMEIQIDLDSDDRKPLINRSYVEALVGNANCREPVDTESYKNELNRCLSLTPEFLEKCKDPEFVEEQIQIINNVYTEKVRALENDRQKHFDKQKEHEQFLQKEVYERDIVDVINSHM